MRWTLLPSQVELLQFFSKLYSAISIFDIIPAAKKNIQSQQKEY